MYFEAGSQVQLRFLAITGTAAADTGLRAEHNGPDRVRFAGLIRSSFFAERMGWRAGVGAGCSGAREMPSGENRERLERSGGMVALEGISAQSRSHMKRMRSRRARLLKDCLAGNNDFPSPGQGESGSPGTRTS